MRVLNYSHKTKLREIGSDGVIEWYETQKEELSIPYELIEDWESLNHQATYLNWRVETGLLDDLDSFLEGGAAAIKVVLCGSEHKDI